MKKILLLFIVFIQYVAIGQDENYLIEKINLHKDVITALAFNKSGNVLASASKEKDYCFTNTSDWTILNCYTNYYIVDDIKFTGDDVLLMTSGNAIKYIDLQNKELDLFEGSPTYILSVDYSLRNNKVVGASYNKQVWCWDAVTASLTNTLEGHGKNAQAVAISSSLPLVVSGSVDGSLRVWDLKTSETKYIIERHVKAIYDVEFHPNGKYFLSCSADKKIRLWDATTGTFLKVYTGHKFDVVKVKFTSDGEHFFSASADGTVQLWQTRTGKNIYSFIDHTGLVSCIATDPNDHYLATGGEDSKIFIYDINKKVYVVESDLSAYQNFKSGNSIFEDKQRGEKKEEYEERMQKAYTIEREWIEKKYESYINNLKRYTYNNESN